MRIPPQTRIINGYAATDYIPWQISLQEDYVFWTHICGGTVLDKMTILTAAHCYYPNCYENKCRIVAGIYDLKDSNVQVSMKSEASD